MDELLALRTETGQLKDDIVHLNTQIQATGTSLLDKVSPQLFFPGLS